MKCLQWLTPLILNAFLTHAAHARVQLTDPPPSVHFLAKGPAGMRIDGSTHELQITEEDGNLIVTAGLVNLDTGIALRNRHMREGYLETSKFPTAVLTVARSSLTFPGAQSAETGTAQGLLKLHGVEKLVSFQYAVQRKQGHLIVTGKAVLNLGDFQIPTPKYLGVGVKPVIEFDVAFNADDVP